VALPTLRSWQYRWREPPEAGGDEAFDPGLKAYDALRYARENEVRAMVYYEQAGQQTDDPEVKRLAAEFAAEETEHVQALEDWLARTPRPSAPWSDDPDRGASS
jgi:rubrerythrin